MARQALDELKELRAFVTALDKQLTQYDFIAVSNRISVLEEKLVQISKWQEDSKRVPVIDDRVSKLEARATDADRLRDRVVAAEGTVTELKRWKEESEKRHWQFVYIFAGGMASLLVTVIVQLILFWAKPVSQTPHT